MISKISMTVAIGFALLMVNVASAYAYNARLLGMGDMQGIIPDSQDYLDHIYKINDIERRFLNAFYLSNGFTYDFPQNDQPSSSIYEYQRKGARDPFGFNIVIPLSDVVNLGYQHEYEYRDYRASYIDAAGSWQTLKRTGHAEISSLILGYRALPWFDLAVAYDDSSQLDNYTGSETARPGVVVRNENSRFSGLAYGIRLHSESFWLGLCVGEYRESKLSYEATAQTLNYTTFGSGRIGLLIGGRLLDNKLIINYGGSMRKIGVLSKFEAVLGCQFKPQESLLLGFGLKVKEDIDQNGNFRCSSLNLGGEYKLQEPLVLRGGIINKSGQVSRSFFGYSPVETAFDYTLGIGYELFGVGLDFAYLNYSGILGGSYDWSAVSSLLDNQYVYTATTGRNSVYVFSASHEI